MSGQSDEQIKAAFEVVMRLVDQMFEYDAPFPNGWSTDQIEQYERSGALDWLTLYEKEDVLAHLFLSETGPDIGVSLVQGKWSPQDIVEVGQKLETLGESFKPAHPRRLKDRALSEGLRWLIVTRVLKTILTCQLRFGATVSGLVQRAKDGDRQAFLKLATLDATFLTTEFAKKILRAIELEQDLEFKKKLSRAIAPKKGFWTLEHSKKNLRDAVALWMLSQFDFESRPYSDWSDFLCKAGFSNFDSAQNVAKACKRYGIPKKHPKGRKKLDS